jgi:hypothetical protein
MYKFKKKISFSKEVVEFERTDRQKDKKDGIKVAYIYFAETFKRRLKSTEG